MHDAVEVAGEVALEEPDGVACCFAFGDAAGDVVAGRGVVLAAVQDDRVEGAVELAVAAAAEAVTCRETARGRERCHAGEAGEGGLGADAIAVRPSDDQLRGHNRSDTRFVEQLGHKRADVRDDLALELVGLVGGSLDPPGERAQNEHNRELVRSARV